MTADPLAVRSAKRNRVYRRKFDHDAARHRYQAGATIAELALELGVSYIAVFRVVTPGAQEVELERHRRWYQATCSICGSPAQRAGYRGEAPRCRSCGYDAQATSVRDGELYCSRCETWKPDEDFPRNRTEPRRRSRHSLCRSCNTEQKREWRKRRSKRLQEAAAASRGRTPVGAAAAAGEALQIGQKAVG